MQLVSNSSLKKVSTKLLDSGSHLANTVPAPLSMHPSKVTKFSLGNVTFLEGWDKITKSAAFGDNNHELGAAIGNKQKWGVLMLPCCHFPSH